MKNKMCKYLLTVLILFFTNSYAQSSSYVITSSNDTVKIDKFNILSNKIKIRKNETSIKYTYEDLIGVYDSKKDKHYEKISPSFVEYKGPSGNTFFAERLTNGKVKIYKYFTTQSIAPSSVNNFYKNTGNGFYSYFIGIQDVNPELLCYNQIELNKNEYKILKLYLHSNNEIQKELDELFFSVEKEKEKSLVTLVNKYNKWVELQQ